MLVETEGVEIVVCGVVDMDGEEVDACSQPTNTKLIMKIKIMLLYALPRVRGELGKNLESQQVIDYNPRSCKVA